MKADLGYGEMAGVNSNIAYLIGASLLGAEVGVLCVAGHGP
jgi:hypothetical protein